MVPLPTQQAKVQTIGHNFVLALSQTMVVHMMLCRALSVPDESGRKPEECFPRQECLISTT